jgi:ribose transport system substrate-binding protein
VASILTKPFSINYDELAKVLDDKCSVDSDAWYTVGVERWASKDFLDDFFLRPADPESYRPSEQKK